MRAMKSAAEEAFSENLELLAVWVERRGIEQKLVVEITRGLAVEMLSAMSYIAKEHGWSVRIETIEKDDEQAMADNIKRIKMRATLTLLNQDGKVEGEYFGWGEALSHRKVRTKQGEAWEFDPYALRSAETRAFKRAIEVFVPSLWTKLVKISNWLTVWAAKNPQQQGENDEAYAQRALNALIQAKNQKK